MSPAQAFREAARNRPARYAPWLNRDESRAALERTALPEPRCEAWRHTNPNRWYAAASPAPSRRGVTVRGSQGVRIVGFEEADAAERRCIAERLNGAVDRERYPLANVNDLLLDQGVLIRVPSGAVGAAVTLGDLGGGFERALVIVEEGADCVLLERPQAPRQRVVEIQLAAGARLSHARLQPSSTAAEHHLATVRAGADTAYRLTQYAWGGELRRNDLHVQAAGAGANLEVRSACRLGEGQHLDTHIALHHAAPAVTSRQVARGAVGGGGRAVFDGRIHIAPEAQQADATLSAKHLLLAPEAAAYAKPELEIYANDVKCSHGATVGELDAEALFYLRSRGVGEAAARQMLVRAFLEEAIDGPGGGEARALLELA